MFEQSRDDAVDQRPQQPGRLKPTDLLMLESMLYVGLDPGQMPPKRTDGGVAGHRAALGLDGGESVGEQGRRGFWGTRQRNGS